jgi:hypothetical protein
MKELFEQVATALLTVEALDRDDVKTVGQAVALLRAAASMFAGESPVVPPDVMPPPDGAVWVDDQGKVWVYRGELGDWDQIERPDGPTARFDLDRMEWVECEPTAVTLAEMKAALSVTDSAEVQPYRPTDLRPRPLGRPDLIPSPEDRLEDDERPAPIRADYSYRPEIDNRDD